ncbi:MAG: polyprenyl synthetase family protein [Methanobacteriota archaeon]|nr:MAG: polyprenyl synthetase family protein [Euryarchaeota archaeon]
MSQSTWDFGINRELEMVEARLLEMVDSEEKILTEASMHVIGAGGKRLRPTIAILSYRSLGGEDMDKIIDIATGFELIHSATLVHDDINDGGSTRRGRETVYRRYGLHNAIVTGDFLFVKAFSLGGIYGKDVVRTIADACARLAEGEMVQSRYRHTQEIDLDKYVQIMERKTAEPLKAGAMLGAYQAGGTVEETRCLGAYGLNLGVAFQIVDDVLDFVGEESKTGKPVGSDLREGHLTLPSLLAIKESDEARNAVTAIIEQDNPSDESVRQCIDIVNSSGGIEKAKAMAEFYGMEALQHLGCLSNTQYSEALRDIVSKILERDS